MAPTATHEERTIMTFGLPPLELVADAKSRFADGAPLQRPARLPRRESSAAMPSTRRNNGFIESGEERRTGCFRVLQGAQGCSSELPSFSQASTPQMVLFRGHISPSSSLHPRKQPRFLSAWELPSRHCVKCIVCFPPTHDHVLPSQLRKLLLRLCSSKLLAHPKASQGFVLVERAFPHAASDLRDSDQHPRGIHSCRAAVFPGFGRS